MEDGIDRVARLRALLTDPDIHTVRQGLELLVTLNDAALVDALAEGLRIGPDGAIAYSDMAADTDAPHMLLVAFHLLHLRGDLRRCEVLCLGAESNLSGRSSLRSSDLERLRGCAALRHLTLCRLRAADSVAPLAALRQLETLTISGCPQMPALAPLNDWLQLRRLDVDDAALLEGVEQPGLLADARLDPTGGARLRGGVLFSALKTQPPSGSPHPLAEATALDLRGVRNIASLDWLRDLPNLRYLALSALPRDADLTPLATHRQLRHVQAAGDMRLWTDASYDHELPKLDAVLIWQQAERRRQGLPVPTDNRPIGMGGRIVADEDTLMRGLVSNRREAIEASLSTLRAVRDPHLSWLTRFMLDADGRLYLDRPGQMLTLRSRRWRVWTALWLLRLNGGLHHAQQLHLGKNQRLDDLTPLWGLFNLTTLTLSGGFPVEALDVLESMPRLKRVDLRHGGALPAHLRQEWTDLRALRRARRHRG
ncbi:MAG: hypothetical protein AAFV53_04525 [Myxococcota bacterium]